MTEKIPLVARKLFEACEKIEFGCLHITDPHGVVRVFGQGHPEADIHFKDWSVITALATRGDIGLGETYSQGLWESSSIDRLTQLAFLNDTAFDTQIHGSFLNRMVLVFANKVLRRNSRKGSRSNIKAHYDVGNDFYRLWLDDSMTYSSALYDKGANSLEEAQSRKYKRLLDLTESCGERVLEIGCGWGGFAEAAAREGRNVTAVTVSQAQKDYAMARIGHARLESKAEIRLEDYRDIQGKYNSIVSIEMIEAVGERYWPTYFNTVRNRLLEGGRAVIQAIIVEDDHFPSYRKRSDYIRHYTFPGGMLLSPEQINIAARQAGLVAENLYRFGEDYAKTLREWLLRLKEAEQEIYKLGYTEAFLRSWSFYLQICAGSFETKRTDVVHVELRHA